MFTTRKKLEAEYKLKEGLLKVEYAKKEAEQETRWAHQDHVQYEKFCKQTIEEVKNAANRAEQAYGKCLETLEKALSREIVVHTLEGNVVQNNS
jgi:hypothetical protein